MREILILALLTVHVIPVHAIPQKKTAQKPKRRTMPTAPQPPLDLTMQADQVAEQLKLVTHFIFRYGKIVNSLEIAEDEAKREEASPTITTQNKQVKEGIIDSISGLRASIDRLAANFQADARLQVQYLKLTGASDAITNAQRLAMADRFDDAGKSLVTAVERLAETIIALR